MHGFAIFTLSRRLFDDQHLAVDSKPFSINTLFGGRIYPTWSHVITPVSSFVSWLVFAYLRDHSSIFIFCMKLGHHKNTRVAETDFFLNPGGLEEEKEEKSLWGGILEDFSGFSL